MSRFCLSGNLVFGYGFSVYLVLGFVDFSFLGGCVLVVLAFGLGLEFGFIDGF